MPRTFFHAATFFLTGDEPPPVVGEAVDVSFRHDGKVASVRRVVPPTALFGLVRFFRAANG